jgi:hypothetical protein
MLRSSEGEETRAMSSGTADVQGDLEQLRRRFEEFRNTQPVRSRLPESLWAAAAELAKHHGVNPTARALRLDYTGLRKRVEKQDQPKRKRKVAAPPTFRSSLRPEQRRSRTARWKWNRRKAASCAWS